MMFVVSSIFTQFTNTVLAENKSSDDPVVTIDFNSYPMSSEEINDMIETGNDYAEKMRQRSSGDEIWTIVDTQPLLSDAILKSSTPFLIAQGVTQSHTYSWSLGANVAIADTGVTLSSGISGSTTMSYSGPSDTTVLANGYTATHRSFFYVARGNVVRYTYSVTDHDTGVFLRYETRTLASSVYSQMHSQFVNFTGSTIYYDNSTKTSTRNAVYSTYYSQFSLTGYYSTSFYYFS